MPLTLELPAGMQAALNRIAEKQGLSPEQYAARVIDRNLVEAEAQQGANQHKFWETFLSNFAEVPDSVFEAIPEDSASEHDHYIHGSPKRQA